MPPTTSTRVEVFADVGCPFTHVGLRRFVAARAERDRLDVELVVRAWPLEIVNGRPLDPLFIAEEVDDIRRQLGVDLFEGFTASSFPATSLPAMALASAAYDVGAQAGERVSLELRDLLFEQGRDIADRSVLDAVAARHGLTVDLDDSRAVDAELADGRARHVIGSPHFFTPSGDFFCPALDIHRDPDGHLRITSDTEGFARFLDACFAY